MASAGSAYGFWKTVSTVSPSAIEEESLAGFKLALIGTPEHRAWLKELFLTEKATELEREDAENHLRGFEETPDPDTTRAFAFLLYPGAPDEPIGARGRNSIPFVGKPDELVGKMLEHRPELATALARRFPLFRVPACEYMIRAVSVVNAQVALISALPGILPWTAPFLPVSSVADTILLTKNQWILIMRLSVAHGQKIGLGHLKEIAGTLANMLGWRTLARELAGLVPAGIGLVLKASIAYSGTMAIGKGALWFYQTGKKPTKEQMQEAYRESEAEAKQVAEELRGEAEAQMTQPKQTPPAPGAAPE